VKEVLIFALAILAVSCASGPRVELTAQVPKERICQTECVIGDKTPKALLECRKKAEERCKLLLCPGEAACVLERKDEESRKKDGKLQVSETWHRPRIFHNG
jgi:hypothetical protein